MDTNTEQPAKPRRRWIRFRLRTLLIVVTVSAVPLGWVGWELGQVRRERATISWVEDMGGEVGWRGGLEQSWWEKPTDKEKWFGERVREVVLGNTKVSDLSPLAALKNLEGLGLIDTQVSDLSALVELKNLELLKFSSTQVSDLSPLAELKNLKFLYLQNTQVSDLSPLAELKNLEVLDLRETQVSDLSPLAALKGLRFLLLHKTQVSEEQVQELRQALPICKIKTE